MTTRQGFAASYFELPKLLDVSLPAAASLGVLTEERMCFGERAVFALYLLSTHISVNLIILTYLIKALPVGVEPWSF